MKHPDGSIISQFFKTQDRPTDGGDIYDQGMRFVVGQVEKVHYTDDQSNISKKFVEYDVSVRDARGGQSVLRNVKQVSILGGTNDYDETVLESNEYAFSGKNDTTNFFMNKNGSTVLVAFLDGSKDRPIILAAFQHPKKVGAKKSDGVRRKGEYRGLQWEINKDGEVILTHQGPRSPDGKLKSKDKVLTIAKFDKDGNLTITDHANNQVMLDNVNVKVDVQSDAKGTKLTIDGKNDKITAFTAGGLTLEADGPGDKLTITTAGGPKVTIEGANKITLEAGATRIEIDGNTGKIKIDGNFVDVGTAASALAVLGPQLIAWLNTHSHIGNLGLPTSAPIVPAPITTLSTSVKIKA